jgi:hypothetical protein
MRIRGIQGILTAIRFMLLSNHTIPTTRRIIASVGNLFFILYNRNNYL